MSNTMFNFFEEKKFKYDIMQNSVAIRKSV